MVGHLLLADVLVIVYAAHKGWGHLPMGAIQAWLAATVVEVVAVVRVITRSVFPEGGRDS